MDEFDPPLEPKNDFPELFKASIALVIPKYNIKKTDHKDWKTAVRVGHLCSICLVKVLQNASVGQDAKICFSEFAYKHMLCCDELEIESKVKGTAIYYPSHRVYEHLVFTKFTTKLLELLLPPRKPLTKRTPVTCLKT